MEDFLDVIEAHRIRHSPAHDPKFAVSLSGVRGPPHQITAVYKHDDPGADKTIMAGLLTKELWQLGGNAWQQNDRVIASIDFAERDEVMPDLLLADRGVVVIEKAHKCSARGKGGRGS